MNIVVNDVPDGFVLNNNLNPSLIYVAKIDIKEPANGHAGTSYHQLVKTNLVTDESPRFIWLPLDQNSHIRTFDDLSFVDFNSAIDYMSNMLNTGDRIITQVYQFSDFKELCEWYLTEVQ